jgi:carboxymethylenebutenolidase
MPTHPTIDLGTVFDEHMAAEFQLHDADATMATMTRQPYLTHVPVVTGGFGQEDLHDFYRDHFVTKWPTDLSVQRITRTQGDDILIDEFIVRFTHDVVMDAILPGIPPTGRRVELPHVATRSGRSARRKQAAGGWVRTGPPGFRPEPTA